MTNDEGQLSCVEKGIGTTAVSFPVRIFAEPQTTPTAQQIVDHCRQSAAFCQSKMAAHSQGLNQTDQQLQPLVCQTRHAASLFRSNDFSDRPTLTGSVVEGCLPPDTGAAD